MHIYIYVEREREREMERKNFLINVSIFSLIVKFAGRNF